MLHLAVAAASMIGLASACSEDGSFEITIDGADAACDSAVEAMLQAVPDGIDGMVEAVPEEIRADVRLLVDAYGSAVETWFETGDGPADGTLDTPELDAAESRVGDWLEAHCTSETVD